MARGRTMGPRMRVSSGSSHALRPFRCSVPATRLMPRSRIATISPSAPRALRARTRTRTLSPWSAPPSASGGTKTSSPLVPGAQARDEAEAARMHREQPFALRVACPVALAALGGTVARAEPEAGPRPRRQHALEAQAVEQALEAEVVDVRDPQPRGNLAHVHRALIRAEQIEDLGASRQARGHRGR